MNAPLAIASIVIKELYRRKDFYVLFVLTAVITLMLGSINFFNDDKIVRYLKEICLLLIWISAVVIAIATTARQIPSERENRTIFPLLAKPVTRWDVIFGKFLGCWFACGLALIVFYLFFSVISGARDHQWPIVLYLESFWLQWIFLGIVIAMVLLGSILFAAPSSNSTICFVAILGIMLLGRHLKRLALQEPEPLNTILSGLYYLLPHLEFFDIRELVIHNGASVPLWALVLATFYGAVYGSIFLFAAWLRFRRQALN